MLASLRSVGLLLVHWFAPLLAMGNRPIASLRNQPCWAGKRPTRCPTAAVGRLPPLFRESGLSALASWIKAAQCDWAATHSAGGESGCSTRSATGKPSTSWKISASPPPPSSVWRIFVSSRQQQARASLLGGVVGTRVRSRQLEPLGKGDPGGGVMLIKLTTPAHRMLWLGPCCFPLPPVV